MTDHERPPHLIVAGNASVDLLLGPVAPWPKAGTETLVEQIDWRVGGALGNTALALAGMGVPTRLVWDVGEDPMGAWLQAALAAAGDAPRTVRAPTSVTVALTHPDGERTFVSHLGHLAVSSPDALAAAVEGATQGDVVFVGGSFLLPRWRPALGAVFARARARGLRTALDTGWPPTGWDTAARRELQDVLEHVDLFLPNLEEARGLLDAPEASVDELVQRLDLLAAGRCVIKLGAQGAVWHDAAGPGRAPAPAVAVVDTVGAGDTFNAALLTAWSERLPWPAAVAAAVRTASLAVSTTPRRYPTWSELTSASAAPA